MTLVKICGITRMEDLKMCLKEGVDITGFNIYPKSKRYVDLKQLEKLVRTAREKSAIVTVNMEF
ncbi:MAG: phosphoribosylanthranilate isomerase, partial [Elusimicrobiota bacterium]